MKDVKIHSWLIFLTMFLGLLAFWCLYPIFFQWLIVTQFKIDPKVYGETFGAVGDTYGSLNTLVSSLALAGVAYSAYLQVTSLKETRDANREQVDLAKKTHQEQLRESQHAIFTNAFYSLLNVKENKFNNLEVVIKQYNHKGNDIFKTISFECESLCRTWHEEEYIPTAKELDDEFRVILGSLSDEDPDIIYSYFMIYESIYSLVNQAKFLNEIESFYYKRLISNTMRIQEQITLCYISCYIGRYHSFLDNSFIFDQFYLEEMAGLVKKYHKSSHFYGDSWQNIFSAKV